MSVKVQVSTLARGEGAYRSCAKTGLIATIAAGTATAGHLWAVRWPAVLAGGDRRARVVLQRLLVKWRTITGFTGAQEVALDLYKLTAYTVAHSGGTAVAATKKVTAGPAALLTGQVATTIELTAGTQTIGTDPIASNSFSELATAATVPKGALDLYLSTEDLDRHPVVLDQNEGLLLRNTILMGAAGTARVIVEMDWLEVVRY